MSEIRTSDVGMSEELLSLKQMASLLNIAEKTILRMADHGALPGVRVDNEWKFKKTVIDNLLYKAMESADGSALVDVVQSRKGKISPVPTLVGRDRIILNMQPGDRESILKPMAASLQATGVISNEAAFLKEILEREKLSSTAFGNGFAIPHQLEHDNTGVKHQAMVIGICPEGTDFDSLDGKPTRLFMLLCAPTTASYLRLLAKTLVMLRIPGILEEFTQAQSKEDVMNILYKAHMDLSIRF